MTIPTSLPAPGLPTPGRIAERPRVDADAFAREVSSSDHPIVLRGQFAHWPAAAAGRAGAEALAAYVSRFGSGAPVEIMLGAPEIDGRFFYDEGLAKLNFGRHRVPLPAMMAELLRLADDPAPHTLYASAAAASDHLPGWTEENPLDLPLPDAVARVWIGNRSQVATHYDLGRNLAVVAGGRRRFTLFPPDQLPNLYIGPLERTIAGPPTSMVDPERPDLTRYPRFAGAARQAVSAELLPGDAIFIPSLWWHHVRALEPVNVLVNYWPALDEADSPLSAMLHAMMSVRDLSPREKTVWRGWFEHYVFGEQADQAAAHLPETARGFLGSTSAERTERLRAFLVEALQRRG